MAIKMQCPGCGKALKVNDEFAGRTAKCPFCQNPVIIPHANPTATAVPEPLQEIPRSAGPPQNDGHILRFALLGDGAAAAGTSPPPIAAPVTPSYQPPSGAAPRFRTEPNSDMMPSAPPAAQMMTQPAQMMTYALTPPSNTVYNATPVEAKPTSALAVSAYPPYVEVPSIRDPLLQHVPQITQFQQLRKGEKLIKNYRIRVRRPKFPWGALAISVLLWLMVPLIPTLLVVGYYFLKRRGHTFLYLTNHRLIIVELDESFFGRSQTVLNYSVSSISGFTLMAHRGFKKFLNLILMKEKRTFYISITSRTLASFALGSENSLNSDFDPGQDAVSLCAELDAMLLAIKAGRL